MSPRAAGRALALARHAAPLQVTAYLGLSILGGLGPLAAAWLTKLLIDRLAAGSVRWSDVVRLAAALAVVGIATCLVPHIGRYLRVEVDRRVQLLAIARLYAAVDRFVGLRRFEDPAFLDRMQIARSSGVAGPGMVVDSALGTLQAVLTVGGFAGALLLLGPWVAGMVLLAAVPALLAELALSRRRAAIVAETGQAERRQYFYSTLLTNPQVAKELRLFGAGPYLWRRMDRELRVIQGRAPPPGPAATRRAGRAGDPRRGPGRRPADVDRAGGHRGTITVGDVALVVAAVAAVQAALAALVTEIVSAHQALLLFDHYLAVTDAGSDLAVRADALPTAPLRGSIELRDVWFRYGDDQPWVLRGVDLVLPAGGCTAVVGLNGAGKSTLVKLLCRLYDPTRGAVLWDGVDLRDLDPAQLRQRIRAVFQDAHWYDLTARENIGIGDLTALDDTERIESAARRAGVHDVVAALPDGYEQLLTRIFVSESDRADPSTGVVLSGGQWQRLTIARGLVMDRPDLLVLDEPSSALDARAEYEVHTRLREHRQGLASLLVTHRLGVAREADLIVVLADGRIVEQGDHDQLVRLGGAYAELFALQAAGYRAPATQEA